ncbi:hypothetical protein N7532_002368 [Penicillium argentinense]|uniref:AB hydrolase-1 domain-containing protein n=1 Tax=Penicillium argentinense TaxID=1131581 RepID=A0A9W9KLE8_9EURO|nr:uncharacterized protein N7532_002368 [Penicillium argentinense]KAJ5109723.1 hypothetical protein N7532_002368 [Penicillium argentinense]
MSSSVFRVKEHIINCHHTREYPAATKNGDTDIPRLAVKQYIPMDNANPQPGDVTIVAAHANGFPKIADVWNQGQSGILNEDILGNDPGWFDHSRDLLRLINEKQDEMPHPLIGIGHSMGGTQLAYLSLANPRLLRSLVLIDPVIQSTNAGIIPGVSSTSRRDVWPSMDKAVSSFRRSKLYRSWDPRVLQHWIEYGLRPMEPDTHAAPDNSRNNSPVTLATSKHQELFLYLRPTYRETPGERYTDYEPSTDRSQPESYPFYRPEPMQIFRRLPELRPSVLYIFGKDSYFATPELREPKIVRTGTGVGGSGGVAAGRVQEAVLDCGHMIPMEQIEECAKETANFVASEASRWENERRAFEEYQNARTMREQMTIDERWVDEVDPAKHQPKL